VSYCKYTAQGDFLCQNKQLHEGYVDFAAGRGFSGQADASKSCPLVCEKRGKWNNNWTSKNNTSFCGCNGLKPASGSFTATCRNCGGDVNANNGFMSCQCKNTAGQWINTKHDNLQSCKQTNLSPQMMNTNGNLKCQN